MQNISLDYRIRGKACLHGKRMIWKGVYIKIINFLKRYLIMLKNL